MPGKFIPELSFSVMHKLWGQQGWEAGEGRGGVDGPQQRSIAPEKRTWGTGGGSRYLHSPVAGGGACSSITYLGAVH